MQGSEPREIYSGVSDRVLRVRDARDAAAHASRRGGTGDAALHAFLQARRERIRSDPRLTVRQKTQALAEIDRVDPDAPRESARTADDGDAGGGDGAGDEPPLPGGVGLGVFYRPEFKIAFNDGTGAEFTVLCPTRPGGNVTSWLYLAAMNRASLGAEAFIAYHGQEEPRFVVFDWARRDPWQLDLPWLSLGDYLHPVDVDGDCHQGLTVLNLSYAVGDGRWINEVYLRNHALEVLDLVYAFVHTTDGPEQKAGWTGSWGPIVETFQERYSGTNPVGFSSFGVASRMGADWEPWELLSPAETFLQQDGLGFRMTYLDPNHSFVAVS